MNIEFTKEQFKDLLKTVYLGHWMANAIHNGDKEDPMDKGIDVVLPPYDVAIFEEAHKAADIARDFFGWKISEGSVKRVARHFRSADPKLCESLEQAGGWFFDQMLRLRRDRGLGGRQELAGGRGRRLRGHRLLRVLRPPGPGAGLPPAGSDLPR